jgi:hypothetical protein
VASVVGPLTRWRPPCGGHGDLGPWNILARDGEPVPFIDWADPTYLALSGLSVTKGPRVTFEVDGVSINEHRGSSRLVGYDIEVLTVTC